MLISSLSMWKYKHHDARDNVICVLSHPKKEGLIKICWMNKTLQTKEWLNDLAVDDS